MHLRTVHYGTKIEGNELSRAAGRLAGGETDDDSNSVAQKTGIVAREREIQEVLNYRSVVAWIDAQQSVKVSDVFSEATLKTVHRLTVKNLIDEKYVGSYRDKQVIVKSATGSGVVFRPPVAAEIPFLVEELFEWGMSPQIEHIHPVFQAAIVHTNWCSVHPRFIEVWAHGSSAATMLLYALGV
jgi:Fic family protein